MPITFGRRPAMGYGRGGAGGAGGGFGGRRGGFRAGRLGVAAIIALVAIIGYCSNRQFNPITGRTQSIVMSPQQEVALGLRAAPEMAQQFGGLSGDARATALVKSVGAKIAATLPPEAKDYPLEYHLLADSTTVNAFALPGGQMFITEALVSQLQTDGQLAGVLAHETGHVLARHSNEQMAKTQLAQGLITAAGAASDPQSMSGAQVAGMVGQFVLLRYSREHELEADRLGVRFMAAAGYDPRAMIGVMEVLERAGGGGGRTPEFMATHPSPGNRAETLRQLIAEVYPQGVPEGLTP